MSHNFLMTFELMNGIEPFTARINQGAKQGIPGIIFTGCFNFELLTSRLISVAYFRT
jgi:hypothetical protein